MNLDLRDNIDAAQRFAHIWLPASEIVDNDPRCLSLPLPLRLLVRLYFFALPHVTIDDARTVSYRSAHFPEKRKISRAARRMKLTLGFHIALRASRLAASPGALSPARAASRLPTLREKLRSMTSRLLAPPLGTSRASAAARNAAPADARDAPMACRADLEC